MRIALPLVEGELAAHFGHCEEFVFFDVDEQDATVGEPQALSAPQHQPGVLPQWLKQNGADVVIASGMGQRTRALFARGGIEVVVGAESRDPRELVTEYVNETLATGENPCAH